MQNPASNPPDDTPQARARLLLDLLKDKQGDAAYSSLLDQAHETLNGQPQHAIDHRANAQALLDRIGRVRQPNRKANAGAMSPEVVRATIAALVEGSELRFEHPAIIAIVMAKQPRNIQKDVLSSLSSEQARAVRRALTRLH